MSPRLATNTSYRFPSTRGCTFLLCIELAIDGLFELVDGGDHTVEIFHLSEKHLAHSLIVRAKALSELSVRNEFHCAGSRGIVVCPTGGEEDLLVFDDLFEELKIGRSLFTEVRSKDLGNVTEVARQSIAEGLVRRTVIFSVNECHFFPEGALGVENDHVDVGITDEIRKLLGHKGPYSCFARRPLISPASEFEQYSGSQIQKIGG